MEEELYSIGFGEETLKSKGAVEIRVGDDGEGRRRVARWRRHYAHGGGGSRRDDGASH